MRSKTLIFIKKGKRNHQIAQQLLLLKFSKPLYSYGIMSRIRPLGIKNCTSSTFFYELDEDSNAKSVYLIL